MCRVKDVTYDNKAAESDRLPLEGKSLLRVFVCPKLDSTWTSLLRCRCVNRQLFVSITDSTFTPSCQNQIQSWHGCLYSSIILTLISHFHFVKLLWAMNSKSPSSFKASGSAFACDTSQLLLSVSAPTLSHFRTKSALSHLHTGSVDERGDSPEMQVCLFKKRKYGTAVAVLPL